MKKSILIISFLIISVSGLWAQQVLIELTTFKEEPTIIYTAKEAILKFDKQSFIDMYASMESGSWADRNAREHKAATAAIEWLKNQKKPVQLNENMTDQTKSETALVWLVQNLVGAPLIIKGEAEIFDLKENKKQRSIGILVGTSKISGDSYTLYFYGQRIEFLKIWNVNTFIAFADEEVGPTVEEIVFDEPPRQEIQDTDDESKVYTITEIQPEYPGGMGKFGEYVKSSLKYPKDAVNQKIEGTVWIEFVVLETGKLSDFKVIKGISTSCDKEALRLCERSINWKPAQQRGKAVKCRFVTPIKFRLSDLEKK